MLLTCCPPCSPIRSIDIVISPKREWFSPLWGHTRPPRPDSFHQKQLAVCAARSRYDLHQRRPVQSVSSVDALLRFGVAIGRMRGVVSIASNQKGQLLREARLVDLLRDRLRAVEIGRGQER